MQQQIIQGKVYVSEMKFIEYWKGEKLSEMCRLTVGICGVRNRGT